MVYWGRSSRRRSLQNRPASTGARFAKGSLQAPKSSDLAELSGFENAPHDGRSRSRARFGGRKIGPDEVAEQSSPSSGLGGDWWTRFDQLLAEIIRQRAHSVACHVDHDACRPGCSSKIKVGTLCLPEPTGRWASSPSRTRRRTVAPLAFNCRSSHPRCVLLS